MNALDKLKLFKWNIDFETINAGIQCVGITYHNQTFEVQIVLH